METPKPTDAHKRLEKLAGRWSGEEHMSPSPFDPEGGEATGRVDNRVALDGFVVVQDYEQERGGVVAYRGHGIFTWDATRDEYVLYWFDVMGMPPSEYRGNFEGETLTLTGKTPRGHYRVVFDLGKTDGYSYKAHVSPDGRSWQTFMEGSYTREG
ncbi:MAG: DUF1579 family protein [Acidobacteriota bacterium]|nr:DUF1579 family protein [Acidobacteriota bacterium]